MDQRNHNFSTHLSINKKITCKNCFRSTIISAEQGTEVSHWSYSTWKPKK